MCSNSSRENSELNYFVGKYAFRSQQGWLLSPASQWTSPLTTQSLPSITFVLLSVTDLYNFVLLNILLSILGNFRFAVDARKSVIDFPFSSFKESSHSVTADLTVSYLVEYLWCKMGCYCSSGGNVYEVWPIIGIILRSYWVLLPFGNFILLSPC